MIVRYESWGAWVKLEGEVTTPLGENGAIVALDREGVRALGLDGGSAWTAPYLPSAPLEIHLAVTSKCAAGCEGCYLDARPDGAHVPREELERTMDAMKSTGIFTVAFGGGEPTTRPDLGELAEAARARGITPVLTTSGIGLGPGKIAKLGAFAQVNVSYDGAGDGYESVRGFDGRSAAESAIEHLCEANVRVGINVVLTRDSFDGLGETLLRARALGAKEAQLLRYKPAGRAATLDYLARRLSPDQAASLGPTLRRLTREHDALGPGFSIRIDCALVPFLSADPELSQKPEVLARFGIFGCEAGEALASVRADGYVSPCSFASPTALRGVDLAGHTTDPELTRWREHRLSPDEPCASCTLRPVCKGGCKVVSSFVDHVHGPDPECPRVRAHRRPGLLA